VVGLFVESFQGVERLVLGVVFACAVLTIFVRIFTILIASVSSESKSIAYNLEAFSS
jgi:hypothetical protein